MRSCFLISGYIPSKEADSGMLLVFWNNSSGWNCSPLEATQYSTKKRAKNALNTTKNHALDLANNIKISKSREYSWLYELYKNNNNNNDDDGDELEFDEDGECIGDDTWDYPGSPYLDDDSDIY